MQTFDKIIRKCRELGGEYPDVVFIGGVAVYLHASSAGTGVPPEASHDADFMVSVFDYGAIKDAEEVTANPRLGKHQMLSGGVEFDVYVDRWNKLIVPYAEVATYSVTVEGVRVASLEHLLVLKLEALGKRGHTRKGDKDRGDVVQLGLMIGRKSRGKLLEPYLREDHLESLVSLAGSAVFYELCGGDAHDARRVREAFTVFVGTLA